MNTLHLQHLAGRFFLLQKYNLTARATLLRGIELIITNKVRTKELHTINDGTLSYLNTILMTLTRMRWHTLYADIVDLHLGLNEVGCIVYNGKVVMIDENGEEKHV